MNLLFLTSGRYVPSSRFRVQQYVPHLRRLGHRCAVAHSHPPKYQHYRAIGWRASIRLRRLLRHLDRLRIRWGDFDIVLLERELFDDESYDVETAIRDACRTMILDVDDALFLKYPAKFQALAQMCDAVLAGNEQLRDEVAPYNQNVTLLPTAVDLAHYTPRTAARDDDQAIVIGWTGTAANLANLRLIELPLRSLSRSKRLRFRIIAEAKAPLSTLELDGVTWEHRPWRKATELEDLQQIDIGVMPLEDTDWNRFKCGFKIIQYMGIGVPAVASPVGVNREIIQDGVNGFLAGSDEQWTEKLGRLIDDVALRKRLGSCGRQTAEQRYSIGANLPVLLHAFEEAMARIRMR